MVGKGVLNSQSLHIMHGETWKLFASLDIGHVLDVAFGEDEIDVFEGAMRCLWVEEVAVQLSVCIKSKPNQKWVT